MENPPDSERLAAVEPLEVLISPPEPLFNTLTDFASQTLDAPKALISLVDQKRHWFKSWVNLDVDPTAPEISKC